LAAAATPSWAATLIGALNEPISVAAQDGVAAAAKGAAAKGR